MVVHWRRRRSRPHARRRLAPCFHRLAVRQHGNCALGM